VATGRARGLRYRALPPRGSRWHACNNASVGYLDRTSFYLFHLHPSCGLLSRVKLDECETSRSTYTEQIHTYPELIHVLPGFLYSERAGNHSTDHWLSFKRSVSSLRRLLSFSIFLNFSRTNSVRETVVHRYTWTDTITYNLKLQNFFCFFNKNFLAFFYLFMQTRTT